MKKFNNFIGGKWVGPESDEYFDNRNPADRGDVIGRFPLSDRRDVEKAVESAKRGFARWRRTPAPARGDILRTVGDLLTKRKEEIADAMTREMGKPLQETRGDVQEGIDTAYYAASEGRRLFGKTVPSELKNKWAMSFRRPIGVAGLICPFNFPLAIPTWKMFPALLCGNSVIFKPAEDVPHTGTLLVEILLQAGLPPEVIQLVHGKGEDVGAAIVEHPDIPLISFTGSTETGRIVGETCGRMHKRLSLEMGGKNAQIVMDDADLDLALEGALWGAFGTTGQRCTATSRIIVQKGVYGDFTQRLVERARKLKVGNGLDESVEMGPASNKAQLETDLSYIEIGRQEGARLLCGGHRLEGGPYQHGWFLEPTVFGDVDPKMRIAQEEIFGPVLSVIPCDHLEHAIEIANGVTYGLSSALYTRDVNRAFQAMRDLHAGITYINAPTIGAEVHLPFGGVKATGNGHREGGIGAIDFYTEWKSVYVDYSDKLQKAQIDRPE